MREWFDLKQVYNLEIMMSLLPARSVPVMRTPGTNEYRVRRTAEPESKRRKRPPRISRRFS